MPRKRNQAAGNDRQPPASGNNGAWRKYALLAAAAAALWARAPSAPARRLATQLKKGRALFEAGRWREAVVALDLRREAAALRSDAERREFWPQLHAAAAHRAQSQLRAADGAPTAESRRRGVEGAVALFEAALLMDDQAYSFLDLVYDACRAYWRLGRGKEAEALFETARAKATAFPWHSSRQMPCCGALAALPPGREKPWHTIEEHDLPRVLRDRAGAIRSEFQAADLNQLVTLAPEGHGAEFTHQGTGRPWRELVLYDGEKSGWDASLCAAFPETCRLLKNEPSLVRVAAHAPRPRYCCRVSVLMLAPGAHVNVHTAPTNVRLKAHLVLAAPRDGAAFLAVGGERRNYTKNGLLVFDDSFFHEALNGHGTKARYVLSVDFWKPGLLG